MASAILSGWKVKQEGNGATCWFGKFHFPQSDYFVTVFAELASNYVGSDATECVFNAEVKIFSCFDPINFVSSPEPDCIRLNLCIGIKDVFVKQDEYCLII